MPVIEDVVIMIPAYNPDDKFTAFLEKLKSEGYRYIVVINDGSREDTEHYFRTAKEQYGCEVVEHGINLGQGRAYKSGINRYFLKRKSGEYANTIGIIQCDCDGQHDVEDITRCAELLRQYPEEFILGERNFSDKTIPLRSRFGNHMTSFVFRFFCGLDISDTQTGLKGIPVSFLKRMMEIPGERFEYASSVLLETKKCGVKIHRFSIRTIYINNNETSHFNPVLDSVRIYSLIFKYLLSSLSAFVIDIVAFTIMVALLRGGSTEQYYVLVSTLCAKVISCTYTFFVNKNIVFQYKGKGYVPLLKFIILCVGQAFASGLLTTALVMWNGWYESIDKIIVDVILFFVSYQIQNRWVFKR